MATITVPAAVVIDAATKTIERIIAERERRNEANIQKQIDQSVSSMFRRALGLPSISRAQAIQNLEKILFGPYPSIYAYDELVLAKKLLVLAKNGDPVTLNENDCAILFQ